jgi:hypothetical protein
MEQERDQHLDFQLNIIDHENKREKKNLIQKNVDYYR